MEEMHKTRYWGRSTELPSPLGMPPYQAINVFTHSGYSIIFIIYLLPTSAPRGWGHGIESPHPLITLFGLSSDQFPC